MYADHEGASKQASLALLTSVCDIRRILMLLRIADSLVVNIGMHAHMLVTSMLVSHLDQLSDAFTTTIRIMMSTF